MLIMLQMTNQKRIYMHISRELRLQTLFDQDKNTIVLIRKTIQNNVCSHSLSQIISYGNRKIKNI